MAGDSFEVLRRLATALSGAVTTEDVIGVVARETLAALGACAGFVARMTPDGSALEIVRPLGPHEQALPRCGFPTSAAVPTAEAVRTGQPIFLPDVAARTARYPTWQQGRWAGYGAWAALPLVAHGNTLGAMLLCFAEAARFEDAERQLIFAVAELSALAMDRALSLEEERRARTRAEEAEERLLFIAEASRVLSSSLDYHTTLQALARLAIPHLAEWCSVDLFEDGDLRRVATAHATEEGERLGWELTRRYPVTLDDPYTEALVYREGMPILVEQINDAMLEAFARDPEHLRILRGLGLGSCLLVPMKAHDRTLGVLSWTVSGARRPYGAADLALAEEVGRRAGLAIENARAYAAARDADRRKDEFLAVLGHELRNPLAPIHTALEVLKLRGRSDRELQVMERQVRHLTRLVDDLMDLSRIRRGRVELKREVLDAKQVIAQAVEMASPLFDQKQQHVTVSSTDAPVMFDGDAIRLQQVVANLLTNAARYTPVGGNVTVRLLSEDGVATIAVRDDGIGIAPELLPQVFDSFVQGTRGLDRAEGGLGIGLSLVRSLVELHGGTVEARSDGQGRGSEFLVRLPVCEGTPDRERSAPRPVAGQKRILVVDDNEDAVELIRDVLVEIGYEVTTALDGVEALRVAEELKPDVALLDLGLPVMDGYELAQRLRQMEPAPRLVAITGYGQESDRARSRRAGFAVHLTKPVSIEQVVAAIEGERSPMRSSG